MLYGNSSWKHLGSPLGLLPASCVSNMANPVRSLSHSDPGRLATGQTKGPQETASSEVRHLSARKNNPVDSFDPALEVVASRNAIVNYTKTADSVHPDFAGLRMKNKNLLAELRTLQRKLFRDETSLQEMKTELARYKEEQSFQIMSLRDEVKDLQELIISLTRIKSLKNSNIQSLERGNCDLTKRVTELEKLLRIHLAEREKAEQKAYFLVNKLPHPSRFPPANIKGQEDSLDIFVGKDKGKAFPTRNSERDIIHSEGPTDGQKIWDKSRQDLFHKEKQTSELDEPPQACSREVKTAQSRGGDRLSQPAALLSDSGGRVPATEDAAKGRTPDTRANEQSWKSRAEGRQQEIPMLTKRLEQLRQKCEAEDSSYAGGNYGEQNRPAGYLEGNIAINDFFQGKLDLDGMKLISAKENSTMRNSPMDKHNKFKQLDMLLNIQQNLQIATTLRLEDKIRKLQKQLSDLKLSNKTLKTQLSRVNILKDKTIEKLRKPLTKVETMKEKAVMKSDNLKTAVDSAEPEARPERERARDRLNVAPERAAARSALGEAPGPEREFDDFRETIMKMLGFNMKTADKEIINQLKLIIQVYEIANRSKIASAPEKGQDNE